MRKKIIKSKLSLIDLEAIIEYYYPLNKKTARRYYKEILSRIKKLTLFPRIGRIVPEFEEEFYDRYREIIYENYRIVYRINTDKIFILRIIDGRRLLDFNYISDVI